MIALPFRKTGVMVESHAPSRSSTRMSSTMAAPLRLMTNTGVPRGPIVPTTMLMAKATGGIAQMTARQPLWEKACAVMALPAHLAARTVQNWTPGTGENVAIACIVAVKVNYAKHPELIMWLYSRV